MLNDSRSVSILREMFCFLGLNCSESFATIDVLITPDLQFAAVIKHNFDKNKEITLSNPLSPQ